MSTVLGLQRGKIASQATPREMAERERERERETVDLMIVLPSFVATG